MLLSSTVWKIIGSVSVAFSEAYMIARARAASSPSPIVRLMATRDPTDGEAKMLDRELAVLRGQRAKIDPRRRPQYSPEQRAEILQIMRLRAPQVAGPLHRAHSALGIQTPWEAMSKVDPPKAIPIRAGGDVEPIIRVKREHFDGDSRMPVIHIGVELKRAA